MSMLVRFLVIVIIFIFYSYFGFIPTLIFRRWNDEQNPFFFLTAIEGEICSNHKSLFYSIFQVWTFELYIQADLSQFLYLY